MKKLRTVFMSISCVYLHTTDLAFALTNTVESDRQEQFTTKEIWSDQTVVASQGTAVLTLGELDERLEEVPLDKRAEVMGRPKLMEQMLMQLLLIEQIANDARSAGLDKDSGFMAGTDLQQKRSLVVLRNNQVKQFAAEKANAEALAHEAYLSEQDRFNIPEMVTFRQIYIDSGIEGSQEDASTKIENAKRRILTDEPFASVATEVSQDGNSNKNGGLLTRIRYTDLSQEVASAIQLLKEGELSPVIKAQTGFYLVKLEKRHPAVVRTYDEVKEEIIQRITVREQERAVKEYQEKLMGNPVVPNPEVIASLAERYLVKNQSQNAESVGSK
jgi:peptidyl-prolyl cis-trans isomerase C